MLDVLGWELSAITPYYILDHLLRSIDFKDSNCDMVKVRMHAETFQALAATEHAFMGQSPAVVALACLADALRGLRCEGLEELFDYLEKSTGVKKVRMNSLTTSTNNLIYKIFTFTSYNSLVLNPSLSYLSGVGICLHGSDRGIHQVEHERRHLPAPGATAEVRAGSGGAQPEGDPAAAAAVLLAVDHAERPHGSQQHLHVRLLTAKKEEVNLFREPFN